MAELEDILSSSTHAVTAIVPSERVAKVVVPVKVVVLVPVVVVDVVVDVVVVVVVVVVEPALSITTFAL